MLKYLKDIKIELDNKIYQNEYWSSKKLSKLEGYLSNSEFSQLYTNIILLKEIINNNKIENVHTTYYDLISYYFDKNNVSDNDLKTFYNIKALNVGKDYILNKGYIDKQILIQIQKIIRDTNDDIRKTVGTVIKGYGNKTIYEPPQGYETILNYLDDLEKFINDENYPSVFANLKPLSKLAVIHHQFESIHPFHDGNGRTGRILNILYLILKKEINNPIMSLNFYIFKNKNKYYELLNKANEDYTYLNNFIEFILKGISESSEEGIKIIDELKNIFNNLNEKLSSAKITKNQLLNLYNCLTFSFNQFKTILNISDNTARKYLKEMVENEHLQIINKNSQHKKYIFSDLLNCINVLG